MRNESAHAWKATGNKMTALLRCFDAQACYNSKSVQGFFCTSLLLTTSQKLFFPHSIKSSQLYCHTYQLNNCKNEKRWMCLLQNSMKMETFAPQNNHATEQNKKFYSPLQQVGYNEDLNYLHCWPDGSMVSTLVLLGDGDFSDIANTSGNPGMHKQATHLSLD